MGREGEGRRWRGRERGGDECERGGDGEGRRGEEMGREGKGRR